MKKRLGHSALLEIGVEEIPARFISPALKQLKELATHACEEAGMSFQKITVYGAPRRLVLHISGLPSSGKDREEIAVGPPPKAAKDAQGHWTQAALGFARSQKVSVNKLTLQGTAKGERYVVIRFVKGQKTEVILKTVFPTVIGGLTFPKSMIWNDPPFRFARPIRWMVALFNTKVVPFRVAGVSSEKSSRGLLALGAQKIPIPNPDRYKAILQNRCILVDPEERKKRILSQMESLAKRAKAKPLLEPDLLEEVVNLTEYPTCILGQFPEDYLKLPREVLVVVLKKHQKFFALEKSGKSLYPGFIGVRNGPSDSLDVVREGYERVLNARLADAQFFFEQDSKKTLESYSEKLKGVSFLDGKENLGKKWEVVAALAEGIGQKVKADPSTTQHAKLAAKYSKADLLTQMVGELPELQGIMGRIYAQKENIDNEVAQAIEQHYWPITTDGKLPTSHLSALVAVADKMDTLVFNAFCQNLPSGSADPFGLRRASIGIIRICIEQNWPISLSWLIKEAIDRSKKKREWYQDVPTTQHRLIGFFRQRCANWFTNMGYRPDEVEAVLGTLDHPLGIIQDKLKSLKNVRGRPEFSSLAAALKRAGNIIKQAQQKGMMPQNGEQVDLSKLENEVEIKLFDAIKSTEPKLKEACENRAFHEAILQLAPLKEPVDAFFEGVMVMVDNESLRSQRLLLLKSIKELFESIADFSKLQQTPSAPQKN